MRQCTAEQSSKGDVGVRVSWVRGSIINQIFDTSEIHIPGHEHPTSPKQTMSVDGPPLDAQTQPAARACALPCKPKRLRLQLLLRMMLPSTRPFAGGATVRARRVLLSSPFPALLDELTGVEQIALHYHLNKKICCNLEPTCMHCLSLGMNVILSLS